MASSVVLIDGIPGSGKTSMAQSLCDALTASGVSSRWYLEEDAEHPVTPKAIRRQAYSASFPALCLARWQDFLLRSSPATVHVLEGVAFQSTVRFMYAAERPFDEIEAYFCRFAEVIDASCPLLVYLLQRDSPTYLTDFVYPLRGPAWVAKLSAYVAATPIGRRCRWTGVDGLTEFWMGTVNSVIGSSGDRRSRLWNSPSSPVDTSRRAPRPGDGCSSARAARPSQDRVTPNCAL